MRIRKNEKVDLKRKYSKHCELGMIFSLLIIIIGFLCFPRFEPSYVELADVQELLDLEDVVITKYEKVPPPPPKPIIPLETPADEILEDIEIEDTDLDLEEIVQAPPPQILENFKEEEEVQPTFFIAVEEMPFPIGGIVSIQSKIKYPEIAKRAGIQGKVFVKAFVDESGEVKKVEILKGIGAGCDVAAAEAVMQTRFSPGKQRGKPVKVQVSIPVLFVLSESV